MRLDGREVGRVPAEKKFVFGLTKLGAAAISAKSPGMWLGRPGRNKDGVVVSDGQAQGEFDRAYPSHVTTAARAAQKFFRYNEALVEDTVAETMARTFERWERVRRHPNPAGWVVVCAKNVCLEQLRQSAREVKVPDSRTASERTV